MWIKFLAGDLRPSSVLKDDLALISVHKLGLAWHPLLELDHFKGATKREMEASRRDYLATLIEEHKLKQGDSLSNGSTTLCLRPSIRLRSTNKDVSDTETSAVSGDASQQTTRRRRRAIGRSEDESRVLGSLRPETSSNRILQASDALSDDDSESRVPKRL